MYEYIFKYFEYFISKVTEIKAIDLYVVEEDGQSTPRVYISLEENDVEYPSLQQQLCNIDVSVNIKIDINSSFIKGNSRRDSNLKLLGLADKIVSKLHSTDSSDLPVELASKQFDISNCVRINTVIEDTDIKVKFNIMLDQPELKMMLLYLATLMATAEK